MPYQVPFFVRIEGVQGDCFDDLRTSEHVVWSSGALSNSIQI